jgi:PAS domain-containing protein
MNAPMQTRQDLLDEIAALRQRVQDLEQSELTRKQTEETRAQSDERFRSLVEATSDWIWEVDRHGLYTYASPKIKDLLGYEPEEVIGKTPFDLMPKESAERVAAVFKTIAGSSGRSQG